ncbi:MAG: VacB/RNase II family 3'-5' exoribonuclease [Lentisphaerae bacterium]|nr:VacB/RNase II family 3'-5' exoribonuclease [Lentisphaerota bacterium]
MHRKDIYSAEFRNGISGLLHSGVPEPLSAEDMALKLGVRPGMRKHLRAVLERMVRDGELVRVRKTHFALGRPLDLVTGAIQCTRGGDGFVLPSDGSPDVFVPRGNLGTALPGDTVVVRLDPAPARGRDVSRTGKVIRIADRTRKAIAGTLRATRNFFYVAPIDPAYTQDFYVPDPKDAKVGDRVIIQFSDWEHRHVNPEAEILEVIGPASNPSLDTLTIIRHYGFPDKFPSDALREAEQAPRHAGAPGVRADFRDRFVFTIDPETARDFDDAISLGRDGDGRRVLGVHIADVSHFIPPGGPMDREARRRGNSVYFPDTVLPMLPEQLSNGLCSLRPNEDRLAFSAIITFSDAGVPVKREFRKSIIRSRLRLTYEQALAALKAPEGAGCPEARMGAEAVALVKRVGALSQQLRARRFAASALDMDMPEYEIVMGADGMISEIRQHLTDPAHQLIEECMIAANEAVDLELSGRGYELLRRVHEPPKPEKIRDLSANLAALGFHPGDLTKRRALAAFLKSIKGHTLEFEAMLMTLKSMKRAVYSPVPAGHFGLAKRFYAHFTSPIRRYPDLVVHRVLHASLAARANPYSHLDLASLGLACSRAEQAADQAEKALEEIKKYRFLEQQISRHKPLVYDATIMKVMNFGMFVELKQLQIQGLVHVSTMSPGFVPFDAKAQALTAGGRRYRFGEAVRVIPVSADFDKRQVDFVLADAPPAAAGRRRGRREK